MVRVALLLVVGLLVAAPAAQARYLRLAVATTTADRYTTAQVTGSRVTRCVRVSSTGARCHAVVEDADLADGIPTRAAWYIYVSTLGRRHTTHIASSLD